IAPDTADGLRRLKANLREQDAIQRQIENGSNDPDLPTRLAELEEQAHALADTHHEALRDFVATQAAADWRSRVMVGAPTDFDTRGPSSRYTRARKLPPEADQIMRDWMVTDPKTALPMYLEQSARRTAFAQMFGAHGQDIEAKLDEAQRAGVHGDDLKQFKKMIEAVTGRASNNHSRNVVRLTNTIHAFGSAVLMPRTMWTALAEPMSAALSTGSARMAVETFANQFAVLWDRAGARERAEMADLLGITTSLFHESVMTSRAVDYQDSPTINTIMSHYYRATLLSQLTTGQRRATLGAGTSLLRRTANQAVSKGTSTRDLNRTDDAQRLLRELGVPDHLHQDFADWMNSFESIPSVADISGRPGQNAPPMGQVYSVAINRLVNRVNQDPMRVDKPTRTGDPVGKLTYALMSFSYAFQKHVLVPATHRVGHAYRRQEERSREQGHGGFYSRARGAAAGLNALSQVAAAAAMLVGATLITLVARDWLYNGDQWTKHREAGDLGSWLINRAMSASGLGGTLDNVAQAV